MAKGTKGVDEQGAKREAGFPPVLKQAKKVTAKTPLTKDTPGTPQFTVSTVCADLATIDTTPQQHAEVLDVLHKADPDRLGKRLLATMVKDASPPAARKKGHVMEPREALQFMNDSFAVTYAGADVVVLREYHDDELGRRTVDFILPGKLELFYANWSVDLGNNNFAPLFKWWVAQPDRRTYKQVVFAPEREVEGCFNMWRGWAVTPDPKGSCDLFLKHVREVVCSGDEAHYKWLLDWLANAIQLPDTSPGTGVVMRGEEGIGKGVFAQYVGKLYGEHFVHLIHSDHLVSKFNAHMKGCAFCYADECFYAGDLRHEGVIKGLITERVVMVEMKFINAYPVANRVRLIMSSNSRWVVPAGMSARRFFVVDVPDTKRGDMEYFDALLSEMEGSGPAALMHFLLDRKITSDLRLVPKTAALLDQKRRTMDAVPSYWYGLVQAGQISEDSNLADGMSWVLVERMYRDFIRVCQDTGDRRRRPTKDQFGKELKALCPARVRKVRTLRVRDDRGQLHNVEGYAYGFPSLDECRAAFEDCLGQTVEWDED